MSYTQVRALPTSGSPGRADAGAFSKQEACAVNSIIYIVGLVVVVVAVLSFFGLR
ncbi:MAG TPA: hypothetical protein VLJ19_05175 [Variovorax sp.]|nr:hypothetical protein [Variovorax sp.]